MKFLDVYDELLEQKKYILVTQKSPEDVQRLLDEEFADKVAKFYWGAYASEYILNGERKGNSFTLTRPTPRSLAPSVTGCIEPYCGGSKITLQSRASWRDRLFLGIILLVDVALARTPMTHVCLLSFWCFVLWGYKRTSECQKEQLRKVCAGRFIGGE